MGSIPLVQETPHMLSEEEAPLSPEQTWELIFKMFGSGKEIFAKCGGGEAFLKAERAAWDEDRYD